MTLHAAAAAAAALAVDKTLCAAAKNTLSINLLLSSVISSFMIDGDRF